MGGAARILKNNPRSSETLSLDKCQMCGVIGNNRLLFTRMASLAVIDSLSEEILAWGSVIEPIDLDTAFLTAMQTALATTFGMKKECRTFYGCVGNPRQNV
jgi:hypothetical protein